LCTPARGGLSNPPLDLAIQREQKKWNLCPRAVYDRSGDGANVARETKRPALTGRSEFEANAIVGLSRFSKSVHRVTSASFTETLAKKDAASDDVLSGVDFSTTSRAVITKSGRL